MSETSMMAREIDVAPLVDGRRLNGFTVRLVALALLVVLSDGFDINNIAFAAPRLMHDWGLHDPSKFAGVFSASLVGIFFGSPLFGYLGDRVGRRRAIIAACLLYGLATLATVQVSTLTELVILRFVCGVGIGALFPNIIALVAEYAPSRIRATMVIVMFTGVGIGSALPGPISAFLGPAYGWRALFWVGGVFAILVGLLCLWGLPESIKYLIVRRERRSDALRLLQAILPDVRLDPDASYVIGGEPPYTGFSPMRIFEGELAAMTPLLWALFAMTLLGYFFLINWTPTLLATLHVSPGFAALATTGFQMGGVFGGWAVCRPIDRYGLIPVAALFAVGTPLVAAIGYAGDASPALLALVLFLAGFCVLGCQYAVNALSGMIYPTAFRANGAGWAFAVGRIGSIVGPLVGGLLIAQHMPARLLYVWSAAPFAACAVLCVLLDRRMRKA